MCAALANMPASWSCSMMGMAAVGKHFPGHGGVAGDTHLTSAHDHEWAAIAGEDLLPFSELARLAGMMPAHDFS